MNSEFPIEKYLSEKNNLLRVFDNLNEGIIAHDLNRKIFVFNKAAERITGYKSEEVIGNDCHEIFSAPLCGEKCSFCSGMEVPQKSVAYTLNIQRKNGEVRHVKMSTTMMHDENGKPFGVLASLKDETDVFNLGVKAREVKSFNGIVGRDAKMHQIYQQIREVSAYNYPVHVTGETGTGKELVANAIHNESTKAGAPFVPVNCGALPEGIVESELFGHVKGAFSGAIRDKKGRFELADGGTIFLDEVAELSKYMQVKLLRVLQEGKFERVGGEKTISVNVRVISATNKDLLEEIKKNNFREDLFYRLNVIPFKLPSLRERKNDIPLLAEHFLSQAAKVNQSEKRTISTEAMAQLMDYKWPGNIRELQNAVQFSLVKCRGDEIRKEDLPMELLKSVSDSPRRGPSKKLDIVNVKDALRASGGNKAKAAKALGVGRATLYRFLSDYPETLK